MAAERPNILWICTDQQRWDTLGCYGNRFVRTPNLDRLAEAGALFEQAYCQNPICTPSRASFLTGRYPRTCGCRQNGQSLPRDEVLVTRLLAEGGYLCGLSGKLHLSACHPRHHPGGEARVDDGYQVFHWSHYPTEDTPKLNQACNAYSLWLRGRGERFRHRPWPDSQYVRAGMPAELHQTTWCTDRAVEFIDLAADHGRPWLFSMNLFDPHAPFDPPPDRLERYRDVLDDIPPPNFVEGELENKPPWQRTDYHGALGGRGMAAAKMSPRDHQWVRAAYWAMVDLIDEQVGRLLDTLDRTAQRDNTLVIFMSDHGEMLGDHGIYLKGPHFYEPAVRVPLLIAAPGRIPAGRRIAGPTELIDLAPALLEAAGLPRPAGMQGRSLWPLLRGGPDARRPDAYCEYYNSNVRSDRTVYGTMLRTDRHKLVVYHGTDEGELYDLQADPAETHNLWRDAASLPLRADLLRRLCDRMAWTMDPLPPRSSPW